MSDCPVAVDIKRLCGAGFVIRVIAVVVGRKGKIGGKDLDLGAWKRPVLEVYTMAEAFLITCFLAFLALFQTDLFGAIRTLPEVTFTGAGCR